MGHCMYVGHYHGMLLAARQVWSLASCHDASELCQYIRIVSSLHRSISVPIVVSLGSTRTQAHHTHASVQTNHKYTSTYLHASMNG